MNPRLCGCSFMRPGRSIEQGLSDVRRLGFSHADVGIGGGSAHFNPVMVAENPLHFAAQVRQAADRLDLTLNECFLLNFGWPINSPDAARRRKTRELFAGLCSFADRAGFASILLIPGPVHAELGADASLELSADALRDLVDVASATRVHLNIEPDVDSCANTPELALTLCEQVPGLGLTLDYSHFVCQDIAAERVIRLHPLARHLHVRQAATARIVAEMDDGTIDFPRIVSALHRSGYEGLYCVEYLALDDSGESAQNAERRTRDAIEYFEALLKERAYASV